VLSKILQKSEFRRQKASKSLLIRPSRHCELLDVYYRIQTKTFVQAVEVVRESLEKVLNAVEQSIEDVPALSRQYQVALRALWMFFSDAEKRELYEQWGGLERNTRETLDERFFGPIRAKKQTVYARDLLRLVIGGELEFPESINDDHTLEPLLKDEDKVSLLGQFRSLPKSDQNRLVTWYFGGRERIRSWEFLKLVCDGYISLPDSFINIGRLGFEVE